MRRKMLALGLALCLLILFPAQAEQTETVNDWVTFLLVCNEGMQNTGANVGNTQMVVSMSPTQGIIRLATINWDTFVHYEGYDKPQLLGQPYRNSGPADTMKVINDNFNLDIDRYLSINYLNLANLIDQYGGVNVDISREERNALNAMVDSKKNTLQGMSDSGLISDAITEMLAQEYYLNDYGMDTHLNGLQAVGYGWLQYDSVYNCCLREINVISNLFGSVGKTVKNDIIFYSNTSGAPENSDKLRTINVDAITDDDIAYLHSIVKPIFTKSENNLTEDEIDSISVALVHSGYRAAKQGASILDAVELAIFPLEALEPYDYIANVAGHIVDYEANGAAIKEFLYNGNDEP